MVSLLKAGFGKPDQNHSFTQEAAFETAIVFILKNKYLKGNDLNHLLKTHPLIDHMNAMITKCASNDFSWLHTPDPAWAEQKTIPPEKALACLACLFHYNLNASMVMRYLGNN